MEVSQEQQSHPEFDPKQLSGESVWMSQRQIADLFGTKTSIVADLIRHLYKAGVLDKVDTVQKRKMAQQEGKREVVRDLNCYSRRVILAVGSRVNSANGEQFRAWVTGMIEGQLDQGYWLDQPRLKQCSQRLESLKRAVDHLYQQSVSTVSTEQQAVDDLSKLYHFYSRALQRLSEFEFNRLSVRNTTMLAVKPLQLFEVRQIVAFLRESLFEEGEAGQFGIDRPGELEQLLQAVMARDCHRDIYPSVEEKASQLLWLLVHQSPFVEGSTCLAAFLFVWFLYSNELLRVDSGHPPVATNALIAMTLLVASSRPEQRGQVTKLLSSLINREN